LVEENFDYIHESRVSISGSAIAAILEVIRVTYYTKQRAQQGGSRSCGSQELESLRDGVRTIEIPLCTCREVFAHFLMTLCNVDLTMGFGRKSWNPLLRRRSLSRIVVKAVKAMIGVLWLGLLSLDLRKREG
jgi:hypothetical protein